MTVSLLSEKQPFNTKSGYSIRVTSGAIADAATFSHMLVLYIPTAAATRSVVHLDFGDDSLLRYHGSTGEPYRT